MHIPQHIIVVHDLPRNPGSLNNIALKQYMNIDLVSLSHFCLALY